MMNAKAPASYTPAVLMVDDEPQLLRSTSLTLRTAGITHTHCINDSRQVGELLSQHSVGVALLDLNMPHLNGIELLAYVSENHPDISVIILTAANEVETAVQCMRNGAFDYLVKPVEKNRLLTAVNKALDAHNLKCEVTHLRQSLLTRKVSRPEAFAHIVTEHDAIRDLCCYIDAISQSPQPVLVTGETGTGKELFAQAVHKASMRDGQFVAITVSGLDDTNFSDTLFGHKKGAFTGAEKKRAGLIASAQNGTLFLDEIGDLSTTSQVKLLRLLQEREYYPLGEDTPSRSNARIVVATNVDLADAVEKGKFRQDLYFRLKPHQVRIPPLRERLEDIPKLVQHFVNNAARDLNRSPPTIPPALYQLLNTFNFPGNVRELEGMIFDAVARHTGAALGLKTFREAMGLTEGSNVVEEAPSSPLSFPSKLPTIKELEHALIREALVRASSNQGVAANLLGITRQALNKRLIRSKSKTP